MLPYRPSERPVARMICDILNPDGKPYEGYPRYVLKRVLKKLSDMRYTFYVGPELEYFYFANDKSPRNPGPGRLF
jgi:glutamine synthetase